jgi:phage replication-related protein YjqB (UPF0714/DUF867 family)
MMSMPRGKPQAEHDERRYLEELLACRGVQEELILRSQFGFMAFHGGSLERETDRIAVVAAEAAGASLYVVRQPPYLRWHIPSTLFVPDQSNKLCAFFEQVDIVMTVHGFRRKGFGRHVMLGGRNRRLARHIAATMRSALPGYVFEHDLSRIPKPIRGLRAENPVNLAPHGGVQVELPPMIRVGPEADRLAAGLARAAITFRSAER